MSLGIGKLYIDGPLVRACYSKEIRDSGVPTLAFDRRGKYGPRLGELVTRYFRLSTLSFRELRALGQFAL